MSRENILTGKYFINYKVTETSGNVVREPIEEGRIAGEAADGWFYVELMQGSAIRKRELWNIERLKNVRLYPDEFAFRNARSEKFKPARTDEKEAR